MTKEEPYGYVSIVGQALFQPVLTLVETLDSLPVLVPNELQTGQGENGYSLAIIILAVVVLESALNRTAYVRGETPNGPEYFAAICRDKQLSAEVEELFALRNAIAHNHLWEANFVWDESGTMRFTEPPQLRKGYGDKRHWRVMDPGNRKSRILKLNMFPSRIWRHDAYIVLNRLGRALKELQSIDMKYFPPGGSCKFKNRTMRFGDAVSSLTIPNDV